MRGGGPAEGSRQWWAGENRVITGLSSETEDPGEPREGRGSAWKNPTPSLQIGSPLSKTRGRKPGGEGLKAEVGGRVSSLGTEGTGLTCSHTGLLAAQLEPSKHQGLHTSCGRASQKPR